MLRGIKPAKGDRTMALLKDVKSVNSMLSKLSIDTIRTLVMDGVERAKSGHPGTAMALAPAMYAYWQFTMYYNPADPFWPGRDRFILSGGHASILLYATLFLADVQDVEDGRAVNRPALTLDDIKNFRRLGSRAPGHPEYGHTAGVEITTGPLGQGCSSAVGMAMAERWLASRYGRPGFDLFGYHVTAFCGDGDVMEGVSGEAASVAGHLKLGNLTWVYDSNQISIEGSTNVAFTEDVGLRFKAYGWHVLEVEDGNDVEAIRDALQKGREETSRPTLIILKTVIGYGAPNKAGTASAHGEPLGANEIIGAKQAYGWPEDAEAFTVPKGVKEHFAELSGRRGAEAQKKWEEQFAAYCVEYPQEGEELKHIFAGTLPEGWDCDLPVYLADEKGIASRQSSGEVLNAVAKNIPWMIGGAADLAPSTKTHIKGADSLQAPSNGDAAPGRYDGRNIHFGVREHAMGAICNGLALSGLRPFGSGFMIFSDYMKAPIRLAALMHLPVIYVFTHDSIGVGEDGPTHQPIEQFAQLRATPGITLLRPADANEVVESWRVAMEHTQGPVALALSRQNLPTFDRSLCGAADGVARGAYVLVDCETEPEIILMASGSEVALAMGAYNKLRAQRVRVRVVSMPSFDLFEKQDKSYRDSVLPPSVRKRIGIEMAASFGWDRYVGLDGTIMAMNSFGAAGSAAELMAKFGFTVEAVYEQALRLLNA